MNFNEIFHIILCPKCKFSGKLENKKEQNKIICRSCNTTFDIIDNIPVFFPQDLHSDDKKISIELKHWDNNDILDKIDGESYEDETNASYKKIIELSGLQTNDNSIGIDVGCGSGAISKILSGKKVGIDISVPLLKTCTALIPFQCDAASLPLENDIFDWAIFNNSFHHFPEKEKSLMEVLRCLKPQGKLIIIEPNVHHPQRNLLKRPESLIRKLKLLGSKNLVSNETWLSYKIVKKMIIQLGFIQPQISFFTPTYNKLSVLSFLQYIYINTCGRLINKKYVASHYILTCNKQ